MFIPKPRKEPSNANSYRPLTLLSYLGKIYERTLNRLLTNHYNTQPLKNAQFGFCKGIGTEEAPYSAIAKNQRSKANHKLTVTILLDIKGAFDHAEWPIILTNLAKAGLPHFLLKNIENYFTERTIDYNGYPKITLERGCPQGSVLGPTLWNLMFDKVIDRLQGVYPNICVYADDTLIILGSNTTQGLENMVTCCIENTEAVLLEFGLLLNVNKTEILISKSARNIGAPTFHLHNGNTITSKEKIKYLGIILDSRLTFSLQVLAKEVHRQAPTPPTSNAEPAWVRP